MSILTCKSLKEVETLLSPKLEGISIISEVPIAKSELFNIELLYKQLFSRSNRQQESYISNIWRQYPVSSLIVTVYIGIYYYDGNYWSHFTSRTGCTNDQAWKECFMNEIERRDLYVFDRYGSMRFVSTILGHAGVPQNSFEGFVNGFIKPSYESGMGATDALLCLVEDDETYDIGIRPYLLHKGVKDYLRTGGKVAEDFVARCIQLFAAESEILSDYQQIFPRRILKLFEDWKKSAEYSVVRPDGGQSRIKSPEVKLDPYSGVIYLQIPVQQVKDMNQSAFWRIRCLDEEETMIGCDVIYLRSVGEFQLIPRQERMDLLPEKRYEIRYELNNVSKRVWRIHTNTPIVFERNSQRLLQNQTITASDQWIILPKGMKLGSTQSKHASYESMRDVWSGFSLWEIHAGVRTLLTFSDGIRTQPIAVAAESDKAYLRSYSHREEWYDRDGATFLDWPVLCVPATSFPGFRKESTHWRIQLIHTYTESKIELNLQELSQEIKLVGNFYEIPLSLLQTEPYTGKFSVNLLTGLGSDIQLSFIKLPLSMSVEKSMPAFPSPNGVYAKQFIKICVPSPYVLICVGPNNVDFLIAQSESHTQAIYHLKVPEQVAEVNLQLFNPQSGETCELLLVTKALSWHLLEERQIKYRNSQIKISEQNLLEQLALLRVAIDSTNLSSLSERGSRHSYDITLRLTDHAGNILMEKQRKLRQGHVLIIDPNWFMETVQSSHAPLCRLWFEVEHLMARPFVLMEINKLWTVSEIASEINNENSLLVRWSENYSSSGRKIRIWDEWHPWKEAEEYSIPDGEYEFTIANWGQREKGTYLIEWYIGTDDGLFSFLHEQVYPGVMDNTWRFIHTEASVARNPLGEMLVGGRWKGENQEFQDNDFYELLDGIWAYGEFYVLNQLQTHISIWRLFAHRYREQLIECLVPLWTRLTDKQIVWLASLLGIEEWPVAHLHRLQTLEIDYWQQIRDLRPVENDFGPTRGSISILHDKRAEELSQMRQFIPPMEGILESYNVPNLILSYMLTCKNEPDYIQKLNEVILKHRYILIDLAENWKSQQELLPIITLIESRWEPLDEPYYINYPYYIAVTAAGLRMQARIEQANRVMNALRDMSMTIRQLTPGWLEHDLLFMESILLKLEGENA